MEKTDRVIKELKKEIEFGILKVNEKIPSEFSLVDKFSVSRVTIRRALSQLINEGYLIKKKGRKGLFVNPEEVSGEKLLSRNIGVLIYHPSEKSHPYMTRFILSASEECGINDFSCQIFNLMNDRDNKEEISYILRIVKENRLDGLLINCYLTDDTLFSLEKSNIPVVLVNHYLPGSTIPYILPVYRGVEKGVRHLYEEGYRLINFITGPQDQRIVHEPILEFQSTCKNLGIPYDTTCIWEGSYNEDKVKKGLERFLSFQHLPFGLIVDDDIMAGYVMNICKEKGVKIPEDIGIIGIGGNEMTRFFHPPLTTINLKIEEAGKKGIEILTRMILYKEVPQKNILIEGELIIRESSLLKSIRR